MSQTYKEVNMATASLALLKGKGKKTVDEELTKAPTPAPEEEAPEVEEEEQPEVEEADGEGDGEAVEVDVDKMSAKELDDLVEEHDIQVPDTWAQLKVQQKRDWLKSQFEDAGSEAETPTPEVEKDVPPPAKKGGVTKTTKGAGKASPPAKAAPVQQGEVLAPDAIYDIAADIENLKEEEARTLVGQLSEETELTFFKLGGVLSVIQTNKWFQPYGSFREYVEQEHGMNYRRAMYWIGIYNGLIESGVPYDKIKHLGWTKLKELTPVLTKENYKQWVKTAEKQTVLQLIDTVKSSQKGQSEGKAPEVTSSASPAITTKTFKVHDDQKETINEAIAKAKKASGTDVDTAALEFICLDYLGGKQMSLTDQMKKIGLDATLEAVSEAFPDVNLSVEVPE